MNEPGPALEAYETDLKRHPNRFNGLYGAGVAAEKLANFEKATTYYRQLTDMAKGIDSNRPELDAARLYLKTKH
jgi:hypothetical protein